MQRVIHFEIGAVDPERATRFYNQVFGWTTTKWDGPEPYWLVTTGPDDVPGINGGIMRHQDSMPRIVNTIGVPSLEEFSKKILAAGGKIVLEKMTIPGVGYQAYATDSEGNIFGIHQHDPNAR